MERSTICSGTTHYFDWAMASIANCQVTKRVHYIITVDHTIYHVHYIIYYASLPRRGISHDHPITIPLQSHDDDISRRWAPLVQPLRVTTSVLAPFCQDVEAPLRGVDLATLESEDVWYSSI